MRTLHTDIETRSDLDVTQVGAFRYAEDPSTEIMCIAYAYDDEPVRVLARPEDIAAFEPEPGCLCVAHNDDFEKNVLSRKSRYGQKWLAHPWEDTAARSARFGLPRALEDLGAFMFPDDPLMQKDVVGNRLMQQLSKPRRASKTNSKHWWTPEDKPKAFARLYAYCAMDVIVMRACRKRLLPLEPREIEILQLTQKMNWAGVPIDLESIKPAQQHLNKHTTVLSHRFRELTGLPVKSNKLLAPKLKLPNMEKSTVRHALRRTDLPPAVREALLIHQQLARSSTAKLAAMQRRTSLDGRLRGALVYCGAERTARWSSWGVQLQNMPRGLADATDAAFKALHLGVLWEMFVGTERPPPDKPLDAVGIVAEMLRGFLLGPWKVGDFAQIEARALAWLAGQADLIEVFRLSDAKQGPDPYCVMAGRIYAKEITKKDKAERFMGKQVTLGAGYGLGWRGFVNLLDKTYDVQIDPAFAKKVINVYRHANRKIVEFWGQLERGFKAIIVGTLKKGIEKIPVTGPGQPPIYMGKLTHEGIRYVFIEIPSGRRLYYACPEVHGKEIHYFGRNIYNGGKWEMIKTYGGKIAENITQAFSRDLLGDAMLRLDKAGYRLAFTVHDEVVAHDEEKHTLADFKAILNTVPAYAQGLPLETDVTETYRYRK